MKIICTQENLKNGLLAVSRIISGSNTLPILNNVLLKTENGLLKISATNLELAISTVIRCKVETEGSVCLPAKTITDLVTNLPAANIVLEKTASAVSIQADHYTTSLNSLPTDEFPLIPTIETSAEVTIPAQTLKEAMEAVVFAASTSETQPEISGVFLKKDDRGLVLVATDRYRLAEKVVAVSGSNQTKDLIIPHRTVQEVIRLIGQYQETITVQITDNQIAFTIQDTNIISRLIDGQYPEYGQIIPTEFNTTITTETKVLLQALKTSGIFSRTTNSVVLHCDTAKQEVVVKAASSDVGESVVEIPSKVVGPDATITFNYRYLTDALSVISTEQVELRIVNDTAPVIVAPEGDKNYLYLVMPIKS